MRIKSLKEHFDPKETPKRILSLDGGGVRGIVTLVYLEEIESILRERHGDDPRFRLSHYFDLIGGTSTGAIIAAALALGMSVRAVREAYESLSEGIFKKQRLRQGVLREKFDKRALEKALKNLLGETTTLGSPELETGLMVMTKRLDTSSAWPLNNNPEGRYFEPRSAKQRWIPNKDYPLWQVVRASTAAPSFFKPEEVVIVEDRPGQEGVTGDFVDGGVTTANNPSLQLLMLATLEGYRVNWDLGQNELLLVSIGTGIGPEEPGSGWTDSIPGKHAINALLSLMYDCNAMVETVMQWLSTSPTARRIDREVGNLNPNVAEERPEGDLLAGRNLLTYLRYNIAFDQRWMKEELNRDYSQEELADLARMDAPENLGHLAEVAADAVAARDLAAELPEGFDVS